jgi:hypothetical protein
MFQRKRMARMKEHIESLQHRNSALLQELYLERRKHLDFEADVLAKLTNRVVDLLLDKKGRK